MNIPVRTARVIALLAALLFVISMEFPAAPPAPKHKIDSGAKRHQ